MSVAESERVDDWVPKDTFASRLRAVRRELDIKQEEAAERCGVNKATWATWELGTSPRNMAAVAEKIRAGLGVNRDWLMWGGSQDIRWNADTPALSVTTNPQPVQPRLPIFGPDLSVV